MNLPSILQRIEQRLRALGMSADKASRKAGKPDAIRNMRRAVKDGRGGVNARTVAALAPVLETTSAWLMGPDSAGSGSTGGTDIDRLLAERDLLLKQRDLLDRQIEGLDLAISILGRGEKPHKTASR